MVAGGQRWVPPAMTAGEAPVTTAAQRGGVGLDRDRALSELERDRFEELLRRLTVRRGGARRPFLALQVTFSCLCLCRACGHALSARAVAKKCGISTALGR
eukprot:366065-Chlamydomonas_euryale.AAC.3